MRPRTLARQRRGRRLLDRRIAQEFGGRVLSEVVCALDAVISVDHERMTRSAYRRNRDPTKPTFAGSDEQDSRSVRDWWRPCENAKLRAGDATMIHQSR
jgi:hypothetical protein